MFGYVLADQRLLTEEEKRRYRACYCGLCHSLKARHGQVSRLTLNFDMTFLVLLLSSVYPQEEEGGEARCGFHPVKRHPWMHDRFVDYAADMNVALAYYNCLDDWQDDRSLPRLGEAALFCRGARAAAAAYPRQCGKIAECLGELARLEKLPGNRADETANAFGALLGELFVWDEGDALAPALRRFGEGLGRFIYVMDACLDLPEDLKHRKYNPLTCLAGDDFEPLLTMLIGACAQEFEALPLHRDEGLLRNILYSGVWGKYRAREEKKKKEEAAKHG